MTDRKIVDYIILNAKAFELFEEDGCFESKLEDKVKVKINANYILLGAPFIDKQYVFQAMVKYEEKEDEQ